MVIALKKLIKALIILAVIGLIFYYLCKEGIINVEKLKEKCKCCACKLGADTFDDSIFEEE
jgi:uncharacterized membrane protein (Fun14 family)